MTLSQALEKHQISRAQWDLFLNIAQSNLHVPKRGKAEKKKSYRTKFGAWIRTAPAWAYVGGMRDALWAWTGADRESYDVLEAELTKAAEKRLEVDKRKEGA